MGMNDFRALFESVMNTPPHDWQLALADDRVCRDRTIRIPTGFGKTAGVMFSWLFHRVVRRDETWPMRLVICLPMRVLVEQTERAIEQWLKASGHVDVPVHVLLGGREAARWVDTVDRPAILVGTQDMLLSRALSRGYGSSRGLWPMEMGLLLRDSLWVLDEVQLMDVGLATSAQIRAFAVDDEGGREGRALKAPRFWWMSATLQPRWLDTVDHARQTNDSPLPCTSIAAEARRGALWDVTKKLERRGASGTPEEIAALAIERHTAGTVSLVILNTVDRAVKTFREIEKLVKKSKLTAIELRLVHSRFRGAERQQWDFLTREACRGPVDRIIVATQVVEAGVDLSARLLVTELAPWPSLVQRFGRCARYAGESGDVVVAGPVPPDDKKAGPYERVDLAAAHDALERMARAGADVGPRALESSEADWAEGDARFLQTLFRYEPAHVLRRSDFDDLFDTTPDLSGADLDVSRFIRSGEERDVRVFWRPIEEGLRSLPEGFAAPARAELCPVPVGELLAWAKKQGVPVFALDYLDGRWKRVQRVVPGMNVALSSKSGGYDLRAGWDPSSKGEVGAVEPGTEESVLSRTSASADDDGLSAAAWKTIATHGAEAADAVRAIAERLALDARITELLALAARWHDAGKAHPHFQGAILESSRTRDGSSVALRSDLAKAPKEAWRRPEPYPDRPGLRHELASTLALFETLRRAAPHHPALLGPHIDLLAQIGEELPVVEPTLSLAAHPIAHELAALTASEFNLVAWLVCTHHGKVRTIWTSTPRDQEKEHGGIHGIVEGDALPAFDLVSTSGGREELPPLTLSLDAAAMGVGSRFGSSWGERVKSLLEHYGPAKLASLEAVLRVADWRASALDTEEAR